MTLRRHFFLPLVATFGVSLLSLTASTSAKAEAGAISAEARAYFGNGVELLQQNNYQDAFNQFLLAYEKSGKSWKVLGNLGVCALNLERDGEALAYYRQYLDEGGAQVDPEERKSIEKELLLISGNLVRVNVESKQPIKSITVQREGSSAPAQNYRVTDSKGTFGLRAGSLRVTATENGGKKLTWEVVLSPGEESSYVFDFAEKPKEAAAPVSGTAAAPAESTSQPLTTMQWTGIGVASVGGLALIGGVITGAMKIGEENSARSGCETVGGQTVCPESSEAKFDNAETYAMLTNVLFISGGVLAATGVTLYLTGGEDTAQPTTATLTLTPTPLFGGGGLVARGSF